MVDIEIPAEEYDFRKPPVKEVCEALQREAESQETMISSTIVYGLSDLSRDEYQQIKTTWSQLASSFKHQVLRALNDASEAMFELSFREISALGLADDSSMVRSAAVELLWADESAATMRQLIELAKLDPEPSVRASALKGLGRFILLGEYGDMPADITREAQELALSLHNNQAEPLDVRRRALEALANSSHPSVSKLIRAAYHHGNHELKIGAIFAMGRSCNTMWRDLLLDELESGDNECVYEAIAACGQIQLQDSVQHISELTLSDDREIQLMAIWALGEIGGKRAFEILTQLDEAIDDDDTAAVIDEALDSAGFSLSFASLGIDFDDE